MSALKGAIVFLLVFFLLTFVTLGSPDIPPGKTIYEMLNVPETDYPVLGVPATKLVISIFNGVVYGFIAWLIYTLVARSKEKGQTKVDVSVHIHEKEGEKPQVSTEKS